MHSAGPERDQAAVARRFCDERQRLAHRRHRSAGHRGLPPGREGRSPQPRQGQRRRAARRCQRVVARGGQVRLRKRSGQLFALVCVCVCAEHDHRSEGQRLEGASRVSEVVSRLNGAPRRKGEGLVPVLVTPRLWLLRARIWTRGSLFWLRLLRNQLQAQIGVMQVDCAPDVSSERPTSARMFGVRGRLIEKTPQMRPTYNRSRSSSSPSSTSSASWSLPSSS